MYLKSLKRLYNIQSTKEKLKIITKCMKKYEERKLYTTLLTKQKMCN